MEDWLFYEEKTKIKVMNAMKCIFEYANISIDTIGQLDR